MRRAPTSLAIALLAVALSACGASEATRTTASATSDPSLRVAAAAEITDGRTGAATRAEDSGPARELSSGGALDPSDPPAGAGRRDGVGAGTACADSTLTPTAEALDRVQAATLCLLNGERADNGLQALTTDSRLSRAAEAHASDMVAKSYFAHEGADGSDIKARVDATGYLPKNQRWVIGENLAWGTGALATPKAIVNAWMNSPGHRANVLHAEYREIGFGIVIGNPRSDNGFGATYANAFGLVEGGGKASGSNPAVIAPAKRAGAKPTAAAKRRAAARRRTAAQRGTAARKRARAAAVAARAARN